MDTLGAVKQALRVSHDKLDGEIEDLIAAARLELIEAGAASAKVYDDEDALVRRAIVVYAKAHFGFDNPDHDKLVKSFESLTAKLTLSTEYREADDDALA